jgi:hypothetical protein
VLLVEVTQKWNQRGMEHIAVKEKLNKRIDAVHNQEDDQQGDPAGGELGVPDSGCDQRQGPEEDGERNSDG